MEWTTKARVQVSPRELGLMYRCLQRAGQVAVSAIDPIYDTPASVREEVASTFSLMPETRAVIAALDFSLEGQPKHLSYIFRLLEKVGLKHHD